jgi:hypothetical protein
MTTALAAPVQRRTNSRDDGDLAAVVLVDDGQRRTWRAVGLGCDPDVTTWARGALDAEHPEYASLFWGELLAMRARRT